MQGKGNMNDIRQIAEYLSGQLLKEGFIIQRYDAYSTNSIYLKLDYGLCNSIRISDHPGKQYLKYRYNIGPHIKEFKQVKDKYDRYYYMASKTDKLIRKILQDRKAKLELYGTEKYRELIGKNRREGLGKKGFWTQAYLVI